MKVWSSTERSTNNAWNVNFNNGNRDNNNKYNSGNYVRPVLAYIINIFVRISLAKVELSVQILYYLRVVSKDIC